MAACFCVRAIAKSCLTKLTYLLFLVSTRSLSFFQWCKKIRNYSDRSLLVFFIFISQLELELHVEKELVGVFTFGPLALRHFLHSQALRERIKLHEGLYSYFDVGLEFKRTFPEHEDDAEDIERIASRILFTFSEAVSCFSLRARRCCNIACVPGTMNFGIVWVRKSHSLRLIKYDIKYLRAFFYRKLSRSVITLSW